ncbi:MAG: HEAT repeat domain-containing protein, partial [Spirochaetales bacterium]|nr:HEAT repeat domain-containing protein [Spirochaetales bacterium]
RDKESIHPYREIYENSILCTCRRGNDAALILLNSEIKRRKYDNKFQEWILDKLPQNRENIFVPTLLEFLKDEKYKSKVDLKKALIQFPVSTVLPEVIDILRSVNNKWPHSIRMEAIKLLGALQLPHCTQYILENLSILPLEEAKQYSQLLTENDTQTFRNKVKNILSFGDAASMAHLIAALPETECKSFLPEIKQALKDSNPEVRIAAVWALTEYNKGEFLSSCFKLLRDPVEHVRMEVGKTLGIIANPETILVLRQTLFDINESLPVKKAVLHGLAVSDSREAIDIILSKLEENTELVEESIVTLSKKDSQEEVIKILNFMDKTTPLIRENIIKAIKLMGDKVETIIEELLFKENKILHKHAVSILEDSGIIDLRIRQLAHRNPIIRKKAAVFLMKAGTKAAFRGIILAAKDPDEEVRIQVVKALEKMNSPEGLPILEELKNDPENRVKKYTLWAMERYEAKKLV